MKKGWHIQFQTRLCISLSAPAVAAALVVVQAVVFGCVSGGAGDNQATNHNRTKERGENQSMGKTVTTPTAAVLAAPPPPATPSATPFCHRRRSGAPIRARQTQTT